MPFVVRLAAEVARQHTWGGTRRRACTFSTGSRLVVFTREGVTLEELPPEIVADPYLIVTEVVPEVVPTDAVEPRQALRSHKPDGAGSTPAPAPKPTLPKKHRKPRWD